MDRCSSVNAAPDAPLACSLRGAAVADRQRWLGDLRRRAHAVERSATGLKLGFAHDGEIEAELRALAEAEAECCGFLRLDVRRVGDSVELAVDGPPAAQPIIEAMFQSQA